jgi:hypothetical protein
LSSIRKLVFKCIIPEFPFREIEKGNIIAKLHDENPVSDPLDEYIESGSYLKDIERGVRARISNLMDEVFFLNSRHFFMSIEIICGPQ